MAGTAIASSIGSGLLSGGASAIASKLLSSLINTQGGAQGGGAPGQSGLLPQAQETGQYSQTPGMEYWTGASNQTDQGSNALGSMIQSQMNAPPIMSPSTSNMGQYQDLLKRLLG